MVFIPGYDMAVGRALVAGVDVWLNNPRRPKEASGTSGMKVLANGGLNLSILDGWWSEACEDGVNGWAIGAGEEHVDPETADAREAEHLYQLLEGAVRDTFYRQEESGLSSEWLARVRQSMRLSPRFSARRMMRDYVKKMYTR